MSEMNSMDKKDAKQILGLVGWPMIGSHKKLHLSQEAGHAKDYLNTQQVKQKWLKNTILWPRIVKIMHKEFINKLEFD